MIWKSHLSCEIWQEFFQGVAVSLLLYDLMIWTNESLSENEIIYIYIYIRVWGGGERKILFWMAEAKFHICSNDIWPLFLFSLIFIIYVFLHMLLFSGIKYEFKIVFNLLHLTMTLFYPVHLECDRLNIISIDVDDFRIQRCFQIFFFFSFFFFVSVVCGMNTYKLKTH